MFLCLISGAGIVLLLGSGTSVLLNIANKSLQRKYNPDTDFPEEKRTLRQAFKPWEN